MSERTMADEKLPLDMILESILASDIADCLNTDQRNAIDATIELYRYLNYDELCKLAVHIRMQNC